jgi:hypothetical protein
MQCCQVDASLTRKVWYVAGSIVMGACLAAVLVAPWNVASVGTLTVLALTSCLGAAVAAVAVKGIHDSIGTVAMLLTDAGLGIVGFGVIVAAFRQLRNDGPKHRHTREVNFVGLSRDSGD